MHLNIERLRKTYPNGVKAIDDVSLSIQSGMFGLLGPNGAGKSSLMRTVATLQDADAGSVIFNDIDVLQNKLELRRHLGYLPQEFGVYPRESAQSMLRHFALLKGIHSKKERHSIVDQVLEQTNLYDVRKKHVSGYSGGMKRRFGIAQILLNAPSLIIVDEPTAGLDPSERHRFLNLLRAIGSEKIVIFSTHLVEDVRELCTDMAIMDKGKILSNTSPAAAIQSLQGHIWTLHVDPTELEETKTRYDVLSSNFNEDNTVRVRILSEVSPANEASPADPILQDFYFSTLGASPN